jgi:hypothetical protein
VADKQSGRPRLEVADIVRLHGDEFRRIYHPSARQQAVLRHIAQCRTAALGGHVDVCDACGHLRISFNSCRDRHCPKCQALARADWLEARLERLLPIPYFHVVFTIPDELNALALGNKRLLFDLLFTAAADTLKTIAGDDKHLGAQIGFTAVLHTWGQAVLFHPHLHCVVTGGGLSSDGTRWVAGREDFFLPVKVLAKLFRGKFLDALQKLRSDGKLRFGGTTADLADDRAWARFRDQLYRKDWVVYAKPPFGGPEQVFAYLGRYTHRVAISNFRLVALENGRVTFTLKDYTNDGQRKTMTVSAVEFLRRFLLHVLPDGFTRIRHYGLYAGRNVATKLAQARVLLERDGKRLPPIIPTTPGAPWWQRLFERTGVDPMACPCCGGRLVRRREILPSTTLPPIAPTCCLRPDTS